jgi:hypothetical protein
MPSELYYPYGASSLNVDTYKSGNLNTGAVNTTIWTPASGKSIVLMTIAIHLTTATATRFQLKINGSTIFYDMFINGASEVVYTFQNGLRIFAVNDTLGITPIVAATYQYAFYGTEI